MCPAGLKLQTFSIRRRYTTTYATSSVAVSNTKVWSSNPAGNIIIIINTAQTKTLLALLADFVGVPVYGTYFQISFHLPSFIIGIHNYFRGLI